MNAIAITQDTAIVPVAQATVSLGTLQAASAVALVQGAREMAGALADVIERQKLATVIQGRKHVNVEGWTTLAVMLGVVAREVQTVETDGIYTAVVELVRMSDGACISRASAECGDESPWNKRARYARRSMAQTRATGKACRLAFSWIMALAGYEPTPAEEMPDTRQQADDDLLITGAQHKMLEARIGELGLNRDGVKTWATRRFGVEHFQGLNRQQFAELLAQLPKMAEIKAKREAEQAEQEAKAEREAIQAEAQPELEQPAQIEPEPEQPPTEEQKRTMKTKAARMEEAAKDLRAIRPYRSGKTRYREAEEAAILENEARHLRFEAETA